MAGLKDKLTSGAGSPLSRANGSTPPIPVGATDQSKLHDQYSINGNPKHPKQVPPSKLDLDGLTPDRYLDNLPA